MRAFTSLLLASALAACAPQVGGEGDSCNNCEFEPLEAHRIPVATCSRSELIITCQWASLDGLPREPVGPIQNTMSLWVANGAELERVESIGNEGGAVTYDLAATSWVQGDRVLINSSLSATMGEELLPIGEESKLVVEGDDLLSGVDVYSHYELWDVGLVAETEMAPTLSFTGIVNVAEAEHDLRTVASVYRFVVDPDDGMDIYSGETLAAHVDRAGYYVFTSETSAIYDPDPSTVN